MLSDATYVRLLAYCDCVEVSSCPSVTSAYMGYLNPTLTITFRRSRYICR